MPNNQMQLPGANVLAVIMTLPTNIMSLVSRQATEAMSVMTMDVQRLGAEIAKPPALPTALPFGLPTFPFPGLGAPAGVPPAAAAAAPPQRFPPAARVRGRAVM